jgi:type II secretion system protein G
LIMKIGRALHKRAKGEKGFTLIELIVVIAVLGALATLVIPRVIGVKDRAETATDEANEKIIRNALERYYAEHGEYPDNLSTLEGDYLDEIPDGDWDYILDPQKQE